MGSQAEVPNGHSTDTCKRLMEPLRYSGSLDHLEHFEVSPIIGREYPAAKLKEMLHAPNAEQQIRDLAVIISERGVCFFRSPQDDLTVDEQKQLTDLLGKLSGRPESHGLHVHPIFRDVNNFPMADGRHDENIYVINSDAQKKMYKAIRRAMPAEPRDLGREWHSDATFEECPADFSLLRMQETPPYGGDTLWCSGYEIYDRISPSFRSYLETLTATCAQPVFKTAAAEGGYAVMSPRGSPLNVGDSFAPSHPVVRTCRVTGWKSVFAGVGLHVTRIDGVHAHEDLMIREYVMRVLTRGHDNVARMRWTKGAVAVWNNSCTLHAATPDTHLVPGAVRTGIRASSVGERPYFDPNSTSRREALGLGQAWS